MDMPAPDSTDPRWSLELGGGALMDLGCYSLHSMRVLAPFVGGEPALVSATGGERQGHPGVDEWVTAELQFPNGVTGTAGCNMASDHHQMSHRLIGSAGEAVITDFVNPHNDDRLIVTTKDGTRTEHLGNAPPTPTSSRPSPRRYAPAYPPAPTPPTQSRRCA